MERQQEPSGLSHEEFQKKRYQSPSLEVALTQPTTLHLMYLRGQMGYVLIASSNTGEKFLCLREQPPILEEQFPYFGEPCSSLFSA